MKTAESLERFQRFIADRQASASAGLTLASALQFMLNFYSAQAADGCTGPYADQLLYQWGTHDWGQGEAFEIGITRQFMEPDEGELSISQLRVVFRFAPSPELRLLGAGNHWCESREGMPGFQSLVTAHAGYRQLSEIAGTDCSLSFSHV